MNVGDWPRECMCLGRPGGFTLVARGRCLFCSPALACQCRCVQRLLELKDTWNDVDVANTIWALSVLLPMRASSTHGSGSSSNSSSGGGGGSNSSSSSSSSSCAQQRQQHSSAASDSAMAGRLSASSTASLPTASECPYWLPAVLEAAMEKLHCLSQRSLLVTLHSLSQSAFNSALTPHQVGGKKTWNFQQ